MSNVEVRIRMGNVNKATLNRSYDLRSGVKYTNTNNSLTITTLNPSYDLRSGVKYTNDSISLLYKYI